jgi:predicted GH43/DUF377 family glycosyl hydrolase
MAMLAFVMLIAGFGKPAAAEIPASLQKWLGPQKWEREKDGPVLSLGESGAFDDTHMFAPNVALEDGKYLLWYCGSTGFAHDLAKVRTRGDERIFKLGLATSSDGRTFEKHSANPVLELADSPRGVITPSLLRSADGAPLRENGQLQMWFTTAAFRGANRTHRLQSTTSQDGIKWSEPAPAQIEFCYAPTVIKDGGLVRVWYADVTKFPWKFRHAQSKDGLKWDVTEQPVMELSQSWEHHIVVYPTVLKVDDAYLMWYGSYSTADREQTAIGFAVSTDGITWHKHPQNPIFESAADRPWESHYVGNQSVLRTPDGSFRMWYASRKAPPFTNLYYAINTAKWAGPMPESLKKTE